ncbi:Cysteine protease [Phytophthora megakarya]|uniref:Cysteine protease n=1 Tax=Phytophthora megakarya TaxID=4795 RepID=A0A225UJA4_9STRA|nr:Cysteine protease [Phytophthora megakarya]
MDKWHTAMEYVADTTQTINWVQNTNIKRIGVPLELQHGVSDVLADPKAMFKETPLHRSRSTPFGGLPYRALLSFCENKWVNDGAMGHRITLLSGSMTALVFDRAARVTADSVGNPFQEGYRLILYATCKTTLKDLHGELYEILHVKLETTCRYPDALSCDVAVIMSFECILRGFALPTTPSQFFIRFMRLWYLLKCIS